MILMEQLKTVFSLMEQVVIDTIVESSFLKSRMK